MGYFAISKRGSNTPYAISACHLNFWVLPRTWFRHAYYFDVGLRILADDELHRIRVAFPFDANAGQIVDLSQTVLAPETGALIFGRPVQVDGDRVQYATSGLDIAADRIDDRVVEISVENSRPDAETDADVNFSVWTIALATPIGSRDPSYIRFRMLVQNPERLWSAKGWGYAKRGFIADLRIADVRESVLLGIGRSEVDHLVPIKALFAFVVAPSQLVPQHFSPSIYYSRLLEPSAWALYLQGQPRQSSLGRAADWILAPLGQRRRPSLTYQNNSKFSIHQWRSPSEVSADTPFRIYADFAREFGRELPLIYFGGAVGIAVVTWFVKLGLDWLIDYLK